MEIVQPGELRHCLRRDQSIGEKLNRLYESVRGTFDEGKHIHGTVKLIVFESLGGTKTNKT